MKRLPQVKILIFFLLLFHGSSVKRQLPQVKRCSSMALASDSARVTPAFCSRSFLTNLLVGALGVRGAWRYLENESL